MTRVQRRKQLNQHCKIASSGSEKLQKTEDGKLLLRQQEEPILAVLKYLLTLCHVEHASTITEVAKYHPLFLVKRTFAVKYIFPCCQLLLHALNNHRLRYYKFGATSYQTVNAISSSGVVVRKMNSSQAQLAKSNYY